jgi:hypothetical protein
VSNSNTVCERRQAESTLRQKYGVKRYRQASRCPQCGHKSFLRQMNGPCLGCVMASKPEPRRYERAGELFADDTTELYAEAARLRLARKTAPREERAGEVVLREFTVLQGMVRSVA